jgi:hypothetical protein
MVVLDASIRKISFAAISVALVDKVVVVPVINLNKILSELQPSKPYPVLAEAAHRTDAPI